MIPSTTLTPRGRKLRRNLIWTAALILGANLLAGALALLFDGEGASPGPDGSTYVTTPGGSAALEGLLERLGRTAIRSRQPLDDHSLETATALVAIDVDASAYSSPEVNAIDRFVRGGGTLLLGGMSELMGRIVNDAPNWRAVGSETATDSGTLDMALSGFGSLEAGPEDEIVAEGDGLAIAIRRPLGEGEVTWLADSGPLHNSLIGQRQSAAAVIAMLPAEGAVVFDELRHGYGVDTGLWASLPRPVRTMLWLLGVVLVAGLVSYGRRFGPAHDLRRRMPPGREEYLDAVGGMLHRSGGRADSLELIRTEGRRRLVERFGPDDAHRAARAAGLDADQVQALLGRDDDDATLILADSALATLNTKERDGST